MCQKNIFFKQILIIEKKKKRKNNIAIISVSK